MQNTTRIALFLFAAAATMAGFEGGCGTVAPEPLPPPRPSPTPQPQLECVDLLEEAVCVADSSCRAIYVDVDCSCVACEPGAECPPCECPPPSRTFVGCEDRSGCDGLAESACVADAACEPIYSGRSCISVPGDTAPCDPNGNCGCNEQPTYAGCQDTPSCPLILCAPCDYGAAVDSNGCATCECLPPPDPCNGLEEVQCMSTPGCLPTYNADDQGGRAAPPECDCFGAGCTCPEDPPNPSGYAGCVSEPVSCESLGEDACAATRGCHAEYAGTACFRVCPEDDPECAGDPCPPSFIGCFPDAVSPECVSDVDCGPGEYCDYSATTEPGRGPGARPEPDPSPVPPSGGVCVEARCSDGGTVFCDAIPPSCGPGQVAGPWQGCWTCYDARSCTPIGQSECSSDADCIGGYCAEGPNSSGSDAPPAKDPGELRPVPPPPSGQCVYPSCGDGGPVYCDAIPPTCGLGEVAGPWNGCWACFDARTCQPVNPSVGCFGDADCPNGYCDDGADSASGDALFPAPPPQGMCVFPSCDDGSMLMCRALPPVCGAGEVVSLINGCWECRDARTCGAPCDASTTDCG